MPYTLMKGLVWVLLAVLLGIVIGWLLRSIAANRQLARARRPQVDGAEIERLSARIAELEPVVADRDRLQVELDQCRAQTTAAAEPSDVQSFVAIDDAAVAAPVEVPVVDDVPTPDVGEARAVLGRSIKLDDLTAVEGIGPKIASLCNGIGIRTWSDLSMTETSLLRTMLADAGSRFSAHDPATWAEQAGLLAGGRWAEFKVLTDGLRGGRTTD